MKTLLAYYSFSGKTRQLAESLKTPDCSLYEIKEIGSRSTLNAYTAGIVKVLRKKPSKIEPVTIDFSQYDQIIVACAIWAGTFAPAGLAFLQSPGLRGRSIIGVAVSASGQDCSDTVRALIESNGEICQKVYSVKSGESVSIAEL